MARYYGNEGSTYSKIYELRRQGNIDEARQLAEEYLQYNTTDDKLLKAYAWTLIDICKREKQNNNIDEAWNVFEKLSKINFHDTSDEFTETLVRNINLLKLYLNPFYKQIQEAKELVKNGNIDSAYEILSKIFSKNDIPTEFHESYGWTIYRYLKDHYTSLSSVEVRTILRDYLNLKNERPSALHSQILNFALNYSKKDNNFKFVTFLKLWGPDNLKSADWLEETGKNGEKYKPLAIKAIHKAKESMSNLKIEQIGDITWLIDLYDKAIQKFPNDDWNIRSKALILLRIGQQDEARAIYKKLCLKMGEKYYIWSEFADCLDNINVKISLLCKAISLEKNEDFIGKIRLELARLLIKLQEYEYAIVELQQYKTHYTKMGWHLNADVDSLINQCCNASPTKDRNKSFYIEKSHFAENYAYADIPYTEMTLVDIHKNENGKERLFFVNENGIEFSVNKNRFPLLIKSHKGQVWKFKLHKDVITNTFTSINYEAPSKSDTNLKYIPLTVESTETADWANLPIKYGYIQHVNTEKKVYHIYSAESNLHFEHYEKQTLNKGDFVTFREYTKKVKEEKKNFINDIKKCEESEVLQHFKSEIVAVDDVNNKRQLFHFVSSGIISGIIHYDKTTLRPSIGDFIKIFYFKGTKGIEIIKTESTNEVNNHLVSEIQGLLEVKYHDQYDSSSPDFAFINLFDTSYYVPKTILEKYHIYYNCYVKAKVIQTGNENWKVFEITDIKID